jgi:hypothetical protein
MLITAQLLNDDEQNCIVQHEKAYTISERNKQPELLGGNILKVVSGPHKDFDVPVYCVNILNDTNTETIRTDMFFNAASLGVWTYVKIFVTPTDM